MHLKYQPYVPATRNANTNRSDSYFDGDEFLERNEKYRDRPLVGFRPHRAPEGMNRLLFTRSGETDPKPDKSSYRGPRRNRIPTFTNIDTPAPWGLLDQAGAVELAPRRGPRPALSLGVGFVGFLAATSWPRSRPSTWIRARELAAVEVIDQAAGVRQDAPPGCNGETIERPGRGPKNGHRALHRFFLITFWH